MTPVYSYMIGIGSLAGSIIVALGAFIYHQRRGQAFARYFQRLPMAVRFEDLQSRVDDLEKERDRLQGSIDEAKITIAEADRLREWMESAQAEIGRMKSERSELEAVSKQYEEARKKLDAIQSELAKAAVESSKFAAALEGDQERSRTLATEAKRLTDQIESLKKNEDRLQRAVERLQNEITTLEQTKTRLQSDVVELETAHSRKSSELAELEEKLKSLQSQIRDAQNTLQGTRNSVESVQGALHEARTKLADISGTQRSQETAIEELWTPAIITKTFEESTGEEDDSESSALNRVRQHLTAHGLVFSNRTINAFHTSLKIGMETPLLVLAGISGTGKSLLPRRYAEAMGIHFLPIAVQPRWDGPQDLLGFFNHLEGKYKATELVRALIQLDPITRDWHSEEVESAHERVLLVLLDEMNLARVEYYFSDFLSRLEARREITDVDDDEDRRPAEIPLDAGGLLDEGEDAARILPWSNILFTGSMNEDESTLALSDKVVDRANIMRFGRPPKLRDAQPEANPNRWAARNFLHLDVWQQWIDDGNAREINGGVEARIEEANTLLDRVGRPFGYRVSRAISAYVRQHPEDNWEVAFADQIEQRIMPKLRGIDLHDADTLPVLKGFETMARDLNDNALEEAIRKGSDTNSSLFVWRGVERTPSNQ